MNITNEELLRTDSTDPLVRELQSRFAAVLARTDTKWFHDYVAKADAILFLAGRIKFVDGLQVTGGSGAGAGSMLIAWGDESVAALERMKDLGLVVRL